MVELSGERVMSDDAAVGSQDLQFERVTSGSGPASGSPAAECSGCHTSITTEYYDINGQPFCDRCRKAVELFAETPRGVGRFLIAGAFGFGAGLVGAAIYYAVIAIAHLEIGIVAILIGYMVGYAVRKGAGGRGGLRFQILAVALTYASVALAYTPMVIRDLRAPRTASTEANSKAPVAPAPLTKTDKAAAPPSAGKFFLALALLAGFVAALPVLVVIGSFPSGLISAFIIFIGMKQAWKMTGAPHLVTLGPYRVGAPSTAASV